MVRWINNIQACWGLPYAYRLGKVSEDAGHDEASSNDAQQLQDRVTLSQKARE